jgi:alpha-L-rhamnosidase
MNSHFRPCALRCEYRAEPLGIDTPAPRFSWQVDADPHRRGGKQVAHQILVASSRDLLDAHVGDLWNPGKVCSSQSFNIPYQGRALASAEQAWWKVQIWDETAASEWSDPARFTMGLLNPSDWTAKWITTDPQNYASKSLPIFRTEFTLEAIPSRALVFVCGLGHFKLRINGQTAGENVLDPGWTNYSKTCLYVSHDVTSLLHPGSNALGMMLGNGMYNVVGGRYKKFKGSFGPPKLILQMLLNFPDGTRRTIVSDESWKCSPGPINFSCIYGGEDHDARDDPPAWDMPNFAGNGWLQATLTSGPGGTLRSQSAPPLRVIKTFSPARISNPAPDLAIYDLGQNFSGWPRIKTKGQPGSKINLLPGELLDASSRVSQRSCGSPISFSFTSAGKPQSWHPEFSYTGFRYIEARGDVAAIEELEGQFVHSSAAGAGSFSCSNPLFNQIHELIRAAIASNMQSVLTDCPHREKLGWLEQSHLMGPAIMFNYDVPLLYAKICSDMREAQQSDGCVPTIAPEYTKFTGQYADFSNSPEWGSAAVINPWLTFQQYGDAQILRDNFEMMRRYVRYLHHRAQDGIIDFGLGDWYDIGPGDPGYSKLTSKALTGTAFYFLDLRILAKVALLLGDPTEAKLCTQRATGVRRAFQARFFDPRAGHYDRNSQTANAMALALGLGDPGDAPRILDGLIADIRERENHITAGDIGFRFVLDALSEADRSDVIFDILSRTDSPSYGAQLRAGATSLTEAWDANPTKSQNHLMLGHAEQWFFQSLAGIRLDMSLGGADRLVIRPTIVGDVSRAEAAYESILGPIRCRWERHDRGLDLSVEIPFNSSATIHLPAPHGAKIFESGRPIADISNVKLKKLDREVAIIIVDAGKYSFQSRWNVPQSIAIDQEISCD